MAAVLARARPVGDIPRYGSPAHLALPASDPRFVGAVAVAAEAWLTTSTPAAIAERFRIELDAGRADDAQRDAEAFADMAADVRHLAAVPTTAELADRRGQPQRAARARAHAEQMRDGWNAPDGAA